MNWFKNRGAACTTAAALGLFTVFTAPATLRAAETAAQTPAPTPHSFAYDALSRFRIVEMETSTRFNYVDREGGGVIDRGIQYRLRIQPRLDLLGGGTTYLAARAETGKGFNNSWNETPADLYPGQTIFNVKSLGIYQKVGSHAKFSAGGLEFDHGEGNDETYVSHDGFMTGYRTVFTEIAPWMPQKISVTAGYVGDFDKANIFSRFRMDRANYIQALAQQQLTPGLGGSTELDSIEGALYNRDALRYQHAGPIDEVVAEVVVRGSDRSTFGWSSELHKEFGPNLHTELIYADLPTRMYLVGGNQVLQNRGEIGLGKRLAGGATRKLTNDYTVGVFASRLVDHTPGQRWVAQAGVSYQFASLLNRVLR